MGAILPVMTVTRSIKQTTGLTRRSLCLCFLHLFQQEAVTITTWQCLVSNNALVNMCLMTVTSLARDKPSPVTSISSYIILMQRIVICSHLRQLDQLKTEQAVVTRQKQTHPTTTTTTNNYKSTSDCAGSEAAVARNRRNGRGEPCKPSLHDKNRLIQQ
jgi:hypothetical protein